MLFLPLCRFFLTIVFLVTAIDPMFGQFGNMPVGRVEQDTKPAEMRELVSKYCRLDYAGARLNPQDWARVQPLVWWKDNPGYKQINVISRYTVDAEPELSHDKYTVTVHYRLLGTYDLTLGWVREPDNSMQDINFTVTAQNDEWRVADSDSNAPHPSPAAMVKWLNDQLRTTQDATAKARYQEALGKVQALQQPASPPPK